MAYRNGTYIAFHAEGSSDQTASDIKYYRALKMWHQNDKVEFKFVNSHEKTAAVRDTSSQETIRRSLRERLNNSKNMVLIIGARTRYDTDFVPYEISYAVDQCAIPIIAAYPGQTVIRNARIMEHLWPQALRERISSGKASVIHIPFRQKIVDCAIGQFDFNNRPNGGGLGVYDDETYKAFGYI